LKNERSEPELASEKVLSAEAMLLRLASETVRLQEEEQGKLSLELQDEIAQLFGNLVLMMDACHALAPAGAEQLRRYLADARETAKEGFRRVQRLSADLRPPMLDDLGLVPTIGWYAERFSHENDVPVTVSVPDRLPALGGEQTTALFRIVQAALHNVRRHAAARQVDVTLRQTGECLVLTVADDGVGFVPGEVERKLADGVHLGLAGIRYRAEMLGGRCAVTSAPGRGTTVVVEVPINSFRQT
jgi:signal transduction histidine kinase